MPIGRSRIKALRMALDILPENSFLDQSQHLSLNGLTYLKNQGK